MRRNNNTYGDLINNKFSDLVSADMDTTWTRMKKILDKEMPGRKKTKWLIWFTTRNGIIPIVLFTLFTSAACVYLGFEKKIKENVSPAKKKVDKINAEKHETGPGEIPDNSNRETLKESSPVPVKVQETIALRSAEEHKGKSKERAMVTKQKLFSVQKKISVRTTQPLITLLAKDSVEISPAGSQAELVQTKRAF